jgi:hypothetical protein
VTGLEREFGAVSQEELALPALLDGVLEHVFEGTGLDTTALLDCLFGTACFHNVFPF